MGKRTELRLGTTMAMVLAVTPAWAQDQPAPPVAASPGVPPEQPDLSSDEVVVYAQKRAENIQDVPISISAYGGEQLDRLAIQDTSDLSNVAANVQLGSQAVFRSVATFFIRGIGQQGLESSTDPSVAIFVDGAYKARNAGSITKLYDVEAVEVLRGPQDALYGRNAFAGAISVRTQRPKMNVTEGFGEIEYGNYNALAVNGAINAPLVTDTLALRVAAQYRRDDGFLFSRSRGEHLGGLDVFAIRPQLLWRPTAELTVRLIGEYLRDRSKPSSTQNLRVPGSIFGLVGYPGTDPNGDYTDGIPGDGASKFASDFTPGNPEISDYDIYSATLQADYLTGAGTVSLMASYSDETDDIYTDTDGELPELFSSRRKQHYKSAQSELRFVSDFSDRTRLIVGGFGFWDTYDLDQFIYTGFGNPGDPTATPPIAPVPLGTFSTDPRLTTYGVNGQTRYSLAAFSQVEHDLTKRLTVTLGLRYSYEHKKAYAYPYQLGTRADGYSLDPERFCAEQRKGWSALSPRVGLEYRAADDVLLFGSWQRGFKSGGFSTAAANDCFAFSLPYDQEKVDNFELGAKMQFLDRRLTLNVNVFDAEYAKLQRGFAVPISGSAGFAAITGNAAGARIRGVELEAVGRPVAGLSLSANVGYLDPKYTTFLADLNGDGVVDDNSDLALIFAPHWDLRLAATYDVALGRSGSLSFNAAYNSTSYQETEPANARYTDRAPLDTVDAGVAWTSPDDRFRVQLYARNLFKDVERAQGVIIGALFGYSTPTPPRTFGVAARVKF